MFQYYVKTNLAAKDYFYDIISIIEPEYPHTISEQRTLFIPVEYQDLENARLKGFMTIEREVKNISHPHYVIQEITITFDDIGEDYVDVRDHILEKFGMKATFYQIIEEGYLRAPI
jgi:hypothetical protein